MRLSTDHPPTVEEPLRRFFASDGKIGLLYGNAPLGLPCTASQQLLSPIAPCG
jgi:hypothetical protein